MRKTDRPTLHTATATPGGQLILSPKLANFRRLYRWFNLTILQQATYPLLFLLTSAPAVKPGDTPMPWYLARLGAPLAAALIAYGYLRQTPPASAQGQARSPFGSAAVRAKPALAAQVRFLIIGLAVMLSAARLLTASDSSAVKLILFGLADAAAFQAINFGVVRRSYEEDAHGLSHAVIFFAASWGLRDAMLATAGSSDASPALAFASGCVIGAIVALISRQLYRWPGGLVTAGLVQFIVITLIIGFV